MLDDHPEEVVPTGHRKHMPSPTILAIDGMPKIVTLIALLTTEYRSQCHCTQVVWTKSPDTHLRLRMGSGPWAGVILSHRFGCCGAERVHQIISS